MQLRTRGALAALPLALTLSLALAGCGSGDGNNVASAGDGKKDGAPSSTPSLSRDEAAVKFAQCLRKHGLDVEDPKPGKGVQIKSGPEDKAKTDKAVEACSKENPPSEKDEAEGREHMLKMAQCMRENGVEKFADPAPGAGIDIGPEIAEDPDFKKAEKKCMAGAGRHESSQ